MNIEFTQVFDRNFSGLPADTQKKARFVIETFIDAYASRHFPKSLRVHKCGAFLSLSVRMDIRIFVLPILAGVRFAFIGDHKMADKYLKKN